MILIIWIALIAVVVNFCYKKYTELTQKLPVPNIDSEKYWGPGDGANYKSNTEIQPFEVKFSKEVIDELDNQLSRTRFTAPLEGIRFEYGFNSLALEEIVKYWRNNYLTKWTERQAYLNSLPQYTTEIQGLRIHFIHAKPKPETLQKKKVIPLLLLHGWPGSVREFYDFIPLLTEPSESSSYVFEVIAPSLVGYGWSQASAKPGFNLAHMATVMRNLMLRVGHKKFLIQGGDWGAFIGSDLSTLYPENVLGYHSNLYMLNTLLATIKLVIASLYPQKFIPSPEFKEHHFPLMEKLKLLIGASGYFHLQATKPDTIGIALEHNPIGLAAYILEKFQATSGIQNLHKFDALSKVYGLDALLDNVMIYYLSNTATSSARFYAENMSKEYSKLHLRRVQSPVPMGCARFKNDLPSALDWMLKDKFPNLIHSSYFNKGGHFAALEVPKMLYDDFTKFVEKIDFY